ncbi:hypothetical protein [Actinomyces oris]|uniref:Uncharacterized protein n=1 Tax=Actinomyces oris TaxID=544580 RepID=A0A1Q8XDQ0_9ACTO|nr:hypothetical protein [Actinomyces oris]OLO78424.1 hypothetical protein BKH15_04380 [Actinomyces oris]
MLYSTERDLMSDHDATQPPTSGSPRPDQGDEFNARTVLINQDMLDAARAEQQAPGQAPGAVPGAAPGTQAGSWRPAQPDLPAGPPPEEQTRAFSTGAQAAAQPGAAPADPYIQANPYAQQGGLGQPGQPGRPDPAAAGGFGGAQPGAAPADPYAQASPFAQQSGAAQPAPYNPPAQPAWGGSTAADGAAPASSPFAQSAPGIPSAPGTSSAPVAGAAPGAEASRETPHWPGQQPQAQPAGLSDQHPFAQQPAPHSHPFSGGRQDGEVGMSSVFPTATARAEAEQATEAFVPAATQAVAQSAPSSSSAFPSQSSAPQWGSAPSSDAAAGQAPSFSDMVPPAAGSPFDRPAEGGALAAARSEDSERVDSVGSWMLTLFLMAIPVVNLVWLLMLVFGGGHSASKRNWAKATLIWAVIGAVLSGLLVVVLGALGWTINAGGASVG